MDSELLDKIIPALSVIVGGFLAFVGNYILSGREFNRQIKLQKEDHLRQLISQYIAGLNGIFSLTEDLIDVLIKIHNIKMNKKIEEEYESEILNSMSEVNVTLIEFKTLNMKYDFTEKLNISDLMSQFKTDFRCFTEFLHKVDSKKSKFLIDDTELQYLKDLHNSNYDIKIAVEEKVRAYYSDKFLPHK